MQYGITVWTVLQYLVHISKLLLSYSRQNLINREKNTCYLYIGGKYRVIQNDCWGFNNLSYTVHL